MIVVVVKGSSKGRGQAQLHDIFCALKRVFGAPIILCQTFHEVESFVAPVDAKRSRSPFPSVDQTRTFVNCHSRFSSHNYSKTECFILSWNWVSISDDLKRLQALF